MLYILHTSASLIWWQYLVNSIRPILCLQAEGTVLPVPSPILSFHTIQVVGSIELDPWLAGRNLQDTPTGWMIDSNIKNIAFWLDYTKGNWFTCLCALCMWLCAVCCVFKCEKIYYTVNLAAGLSFQASPGNDRQKLWSKPGAGTSFSRGPIRTGFLRSMRVPSTSLISPMNRWGWWVSIIWTKV